MLDVRSFCVLISTNRFINIWLKHYDEGKNTLFEDKLINILRFNVLTIYSVEFQKHKHFYNFFNSGEVVDDFLRNVKYKFKPGEKKWIKCSFTIENIQQSPYQDLRPIINSRYWTTPLYEATYFNDFIFFGLRQKILSRVIVNGMIGSSWHFKRFFSLSLKVLDINVESIN